MLIGNAFFSPSTIGSQVVTGIDHSWHPQSKIVSFRSFIDWILSIKFKSSSLNPIESIWLIEIELLPEFDSEKNFRINGENLAQKRAGPNRKLILIMRLQKKITEEVLG